MEVSDHCIDFCLVLKIKSLCYRRVVLILIVIKEGLNINWIQERFRIYLQWEVVLCIQNCNRKNVFLVIYILEEIWILNVSCDVIRVKILEPLHARDFRSDIEARIRENRVVSPLCLPEEVIAKHVAWIVLEQFVCQTLLNIIDLAKHVLRSKNIYHHCVIQSDSLKPKVGFNQAIHVASLSTL